MDDGEVHHFRGHTLDLRRGLLLRGSEPVQLRRKAYDLLTHLARNAGRVVAKADLMDAVWADVAVTEDSLTQAVREIRKALGPDGAAAIRTVAGRGYFFDPGGSAQEAGDTGERPLAVLSFECADADRAFADGMADEITFGLGRFRLVPVLSRTTCAAVPRSALGEPRALGRKLGAGYLVDGSVERRPDRLRCSIRLIDTADGALIWAERFEDTDPDPFAIEDRIASQIIHRLVSHIEDASLRLARRSPRADRRAYELVLQAVILIRGYGAGNNERARSMLEEAIRLDPDYGLAWSYLALADIIINRYSLAPPSVLEQILHRATTGVTLSPEEPRCHRILALVRLYHREHAAAEHHLGRALELNPYDADTIAQMGYLLVMRGRPDEGLAWLLRAVRLNPLHPAWYHFDISMAHFTLGRFRDAAESLQRIPDPGSWGLSRLALCHLRLGDLPAARALVDRIRRETPDFDPVDYARRGIAFEDPRMNETLAADLRVIWT